MKFYRRNHADGQYEGYSIRPYVDEIADLVHATGARTLLDYGCGKGHQYSIERWHEAWGVELTLFDPAVDKFSRLPSGKFDGVICTDVLEHIPKSELKDVLDEIVGYARKWAFISVCCRLAECNLPNGRNEHVLIRSPEWWHKRLGKAFRGGPELHLRFTP